MNLPKPEVCTSGHVQLEIVLILNNRHFLGRLFLVGPDNILNELCMLNILATAPNTPKTYGSIMLWEPPQIFEFRAYLKELRNFIYIIVPVLYLLFDSSECFFMRSFYRYFFLCAKV